MNIVHLLSQKQLTGSELYVQTLIEDQLEIGHEVFQFSNAFFLNSIAEQEELEVETRSRLQFIKNTFFLVQFINRNKIDVIHSHSRAAAKLANWACYFSRATHISSVHGKQHSSLSKRLVNLYGVMQIAVCETVKSHLVQDFKYNSETIKTVLNPLKFNQFIKSQSIDLISNTTNNEIKKDFLKIAVIGRTTGLKKERTVQFLKALKKFKDENRDLKLHVYLIGGKISDLNLVDSINPNQITELIYPELNGEILREYDLIIGSGRVAIESLVSEVPLIAFGEHSYIGLVTPENINKAKKSNFGDIGLGKENLTVSLAQLAQDLSHFLQFRNDLKSLNSLSQFACEVYNHKVISEKINDIYFSAMILKKYPDWIPVLMYHKVTDVEIQSQHKIFITKNNFEKHLKLFKFLGFQTITFNDLAEVKLGKKNISELPKKPIILTFDDGYEDNLLNAGPLLQKYNFKAQIYLLANKEINSNYWDTQNDLNEPEHKIVSGSQRQLWLNSPFEIGSHGFSHQKISQMTDEEAYSELFESKKALEKEFNRPIYSYAFTYGDTNENYAKLAQKAGYFYAVNTDTGSLHIENDPYNVFRVNVFPNDSYLSMFKKTSKWYRKWYKFKRNK